MNAKIKKWASELSELIEKNEDKADGYSINFLNGVKILFAINNNENELLKHNVLIYYNNTDKRILLQSDCRHSMTAIYNQISAALKYIKDAGEVVNIDNAFGLSERYAFNVGTDYSVLVKQFRKTSVKNYRAPYKNDYDRHWIYLADAWREVSNDEIDVNTVCVELAS